MNIEYIENQHSNDKNLFVGEEITYICESVMNGLSFGSGLTAISRLFHSLHYE